MALNVGVNVIEVDGSASPTIQAAPTSIAAFIGLTERGTPNQPTSITNLQQFQAKFGNYRSDSYLAYAVQGFFLNGGQQAYVSRVVGNPSKAANFTLNGRQPPPNSAPSLLVAAGARGVEDPGPWGARLRVHVRDAPQGTTTLGNNTSSNSTDAQLVSLTGFQVGSVVQFVDGTNVFYVKITKINTSTNFISWSNITIGPVLTKATTQVTSMGFNLIVLYQATASAPLAVVETWSNLSMEPDVANYAVSVINNQFTGSNYITVTDASGNAGIGVKTPAVISNQQLSNDGTEAQPATADFVGGFSAFDTVQVQLLAAPDAQFFSLSDIVRGAMDYCSVRGDCMFVGSVPDRGKKTPTTIPRALSDYTELESHYVDQSIAPFANPLQATKRYGALYAPWIQVLDPIATGTNPRRFIPPDGHVMGVYAQTALDRGIWKAPAGIAALVQGALNVAATFTDVESTDMVRNLYVNPIRFATGSGITITASRTLSSDTRWWFVSTRQLFNFIKSSLRTGLRFVRQEPNTQELRNTVVFNVVTPFLLGLWQQGAFGTNPPEQVFTVKCDAENNPPQEVDQGNLKVEVYFYPVKPAETIVITVGQQPSGATAQEG